VLTLNQVLWPLVLSFYRITYSPPPPLGALRNDNRGQGNRERGHGSAVRGCWWDRAEAGAGGGAQVVDALLSFLIE
jgi:hypothetical protein